MPKSSGLHGSKNAHRKADGQIRAGYNSDVAPVRISNPLFKQRGNGEPPKNTQIRRKDNFVK